MLDGRVCTGYLNRDVSCLCYALYLPTLACRSSSLMPRFASHAVCLLSRRHESEHDPPNAMPFPNVFPSINANAGIVEAVMIKIHFSHSKQSSSSLFHRRYESSRLVGRSTASAAATHALDVLVLLQRGFGNPAYACRVEVCLFRLHASQAAQLCRISRSFFHDFAHPS